MKSHTIGNKVWATSIGKVRAKVVVGLAGSEYGRTGEDFRGRGYSAHGGRADGCNGSGDLSYISEEMVATWE